MNPSGDIENTVEPDEEATSKTFAVCPAIPWNIAVVVPTLVVCTKNFARELVAPIPTRSVEVERYTNGLFLVQPEAPTPAQSAPVPEIRPFVSTRRHCVEPVRAESVVVASRTAPCEVNVPVVVAFVKTAVEGEIAPIVELFIAPPISVAAFRANPEAPTLWRGAMVSNVEEDPLEDTSTWR